MNFKSCNAFWIFVMFYYFITVDTIKFTNIHIHFIQFHIYIINTIVKPKQDAYLLVLSTLEPVASK